MIRVTVITDMIFDNEAQLNAYLRSDSVAKITGFASEIRQAVASGQPIAVNTARPEHGTVARSEIRASKL